MKIEGMTKDSKNVCDRRMMFVIKLLWVQILFLFLFKTLSYRNISESFEESKVKD
jgi:hypothetical protein